jgi:hypothetical protein
LHLPYELSLLVNYTLQRGLYNLSFELTSFSIWSSILTELSKPCTLSLTNMHQIQNKEVSKWMSHSKHRITYSLCGIGLCQCYFGLHRWRCKLLNGWVDKPSKVLIYLVLTSTHKVPILEEVGVSKQPIYGLGWA